MTIDEIRQNFKDQRAAIEALPDEGAVLFNTTSCLALNFTDGDAAQPYATGIQNARIFTDAERMRSPTETPGLDRSYTDGADRKFFLYSLKPAKKMALERLHIATEGLALAENA